jgi:hypothetical protein
MIDPSAAREERGRAGRFWWQHSAPDSISYRINDLTSITDWASSSGYSSDFFLDRNPLAAIV